MLFTCTLVRSHPDSRKAFRVCVKCACCLYVVSLLCMSAEVKHKFNCIYIFSQNSRQLCMSNGKGAASRTIDRWFKPPRELCMVRVCLQCLCGLHAAYMFEVCIDIDSLQYVCAEVRHKFSCIFIFSPVLMSTIVE